MLQARYWYGHTILPIRDKIMPEQSFVLRVTRFKICEPKKTDMIWSKEYIIILKWDMR